MRAKEIISKRIVNPIKSVGKSMPKLFLVGLVSILGVLPLASLPSRGLTAYAQQQALAVDPWSDALRTAQAKVEAATTPGAFGHGVPDLQNLTTQDILFVFVVAAVGSILVYTIVNYLLNRSKDKAKSEMLTPSATA
jgi:hypothetical protein